MITLDLIALPDPFGDVDEGEVAHRAAYLAAAGIDPAAYLHTSDELEQQLLIEIAQRVHEIRAIERHNLAVEIANSVGEMLGG